MPETFARYRVRAGSKTWADDGPDLLRERDNARRQVKSVMGAIDAGPFFVRDEDADGKLGEWSKRLSRAEAIDKFEAWRGRGRFVFGRPGAGDKIEPSIVVQREEVELVQLANSSRDTSVAWSLIRHQFPNVVFAGAYVWKETSPGFWSDHAWGTALDGTPRGAGVSNDGLTYWITRMAQTGNLKLDFIIGSRGGRVHSASGPDWRLEPGGGDSSHEWHAHLSIVDHDGRKPPKQGGA